MFRKIFGLAVVAVLAPATNLDFNNPTGTQGLIMIDKLGGFVRFFDPVSFKELSSSFAIPDGPPHELAISPDHKTAYIPVYGDGVYGRNPNPGYFPIRRAPWPASGFQGNSVRQLRPEP